MRRNSHCHYFVGQDNLDQFMNQYSTQNNPKLGYNGRIRLLIFVWHISRDETSKSA